MGDGLVMFPHFFVVECVCVSIEIIEFINKECV